MYNITMHVWKDIFVAFSLGGIMAKVALNRYMEVFVWTWFSNQPGKYLEGWLLD
jgi:hypothetical protein